MVTNTLAAPAALPQQHQYQPQSSFLLEAEDKGQGGLGNPEILTLTSIIDTVCMLHAATCVCATNREAHLLGQYGN